MRPSDIKIGSLYWDGKLSVRRVIDIGHQYQIYAHLGEEKYLRYQALSRSACGTRRSAFSDEAFRNMSVKAFSSWASEVVPEEKLPSLLEDIDAQNTRLTAAQTDLLINKCSTSKRNPVLTAESADELPLLSKLATMKILSQVQIKASTVREVNFQLTSFGTKVLDNLLRQARST